MKDWKDEFDKKFRHKMRNMPDTEKHLIDFIEALIKETERNVISEMLEYCEQHKTVRKVNGVKYINIEKLRKKYRKGVEQMGNTKRYAWWNTKSNIYFCDLRGGTWKEIGIITYWYLRLTKGIVKTETNFSDNGHILGKE
jgi:hypothetical protein